MLKSVNVSGNILREILSTWRAFCLPSGSMILGGPRLPPFSMTSICAHRHRPQNSCVHDDRHCHHMTPIIQPITYLQVCNYGAGTGAVTVQWAAPTLEQLTGATVCRSGDDDVITLREVGSVWPTRMITVCDTGWQRCNDGWVAL